MYNLCECGFLFFAVYNEFFITLFWFYYWLDVPTIIIIVLLNNYIGLYIQVYTASKLILLLHNMLIIIIVSCTTL